MTYQTDVSPFLGEDEAPEGMPTAGVPSLERPHVAVPVVTRYDVYVAWCAYCDAMTRAHLAGELLARGVDPDKHLHVLAVAHADVARLLAQYEGQRRLFEAQLLLGGMGADLGEEQPET